ncbi:hypothetical protein SFRURICE_010826, partial [Spodoptera frugiperda]
YDFLPCRRCVYKHTSSNTHDNRHEKIIYLSHKQCGNRTRYALRCSRLPSYRANLEVKVYLKQNSKLNYMIIFLYGLLIQFNSKIKQFLSPSNLPFLFHNLPVNKNSASSNDIRDIRDHKPFDLFNSVQYETEIGLYSRTIQLTEIHLLPGNNQVTVSLVEWSQDCQARGLEFVSQSGEVLLGFFSHGDWKCGRYMAIGSPHIIWDSQHIL